MKFVQRLNVQKVKFVERSKIAPRSKFAQRLEFFRSFSFAIRRMKFGAHLPPVKRDLPPALPRPQPLRPSAVNPRSL